MGSRLGLARHQVSGNRFKISTVGAAGNEAACRALMTSRPGGFSKYARARSYLRSI
jgi:hypothetical protein